MFILLVLTIRVLRGAEKLFPRVFNIGTGLLVPLIVYVNVFRHRVTKTILNVLTNVL